jgi:hypothetical protein
MSFQPLHYFVTNKLKTLDDISLEGPEVLNFFFSNVKSDWSFGMKTCEAQLWVVSGEQRPTIKSP